jgi:hypothetical protein
MEEKIESPKCNYEELEKEAQDRYRKWCTKQGHIYQCPGEAKWEDNNIVLLNIDGELARYRLNDKTGKLRKVLRAKRKSAYDIVEGAYDELANLKPTPEEIEEFAKFKEDANEAYGVVTYSKSHGGDRYFFRWHDTWEQKSGGRAHIDIGYVDEKYVHRRDVPDTTHLMLDKYSAWEFVDFIKTRRIGAKC